MNLMPRVFYKGGASSGGGKNEGKYSREYNEVKEQWKTMLEKVEANGMGSEIDPIIRDMNELIEKLERANGGPLNNEEMVQISTYEFPLLAPFLRGGSSIVGGYNWNGKPFFNFTDTLDLSTLSLNRSGFVEFSKSLKINGISVEDRYQHAKEGLANMRTAMVRDRNGNLKILRYSDYKSNKAFASELRSNGYKVLNVWKGNKKNSQVYDWEYLHRK